jgi:GMP synthase (glutamine-hydrolysing)
VQGDSRSYRPVLVVDRPDAQDHATELINRYTGANRVIGLARAAAPVSQMRVGRAVMCRTRLERLRQADAIVRQATHETGFDHQVWQFPVILIPLGTPDRPDSVVLRPVDSVDGMTARSVPLPEPLLARLTSELLALDGVAAVFCDLTHKPPGTIEWE